MIVNYDLAKLQRVLDDFHKVTGITIALCDTQLRYITKNKPLNESEDFCEFLQAVLNNTGCKKSDSTLFAAAAQTGKPQIHRCYRGLLDMCVPVQKEGVPLAYMIMGRIRVSERMPEALSMAFPEKERERAEALYRALPLYSEETAHAAARLASILASYILSENLLLAKKTEEGERLCAYVDAHLCEELSAARICRDLHLSKAMLYRLFASNMGCGVNTYVTARRLELAKSLLAGSSLSVAEICERVGIFNYTYFCRLFKKRIGMTPLQYRKNK